MIIVCHNLLTILVHFNLNQQKYFETGEKVLIQQSMHRITSNTFKYGNENCKDIRVNFPGNYALVLDSLIRFLKFTLTLASIV